MREEGSIEGWKIAEMIQNGPGRGQQGPMGSEFGPEFGSKFTPYKKFGFGLLPNPKYNTPFFPNPNPARTPDKILDGEGKGYSNKLFHCT